MRKSKNKAVPLTREDVLTFVADAYRQGADMIIDDLQTATRHLEEEKRVQAILDVPVQHSEFVVSIRVRHTANADEDSNYLTVLQKELSDDEFRFVTDHFEVIGVNFEEATNV